MKIILLTTLLIAFVLLPVYAFAELSKARANQDVIIVGAGIAGLSAALDLARAGAKVRVIDMNSLGSGHAILATGIALVDTPRQRELGYRDSPQQAVNDWLSYTQDGDADWLEFYATRSSELVFNWLNELGVVFNNVIADDTSRSIARFHFPDGHGREIVLPIYREVLKHNNVTLDFNTEVIDIIATEGRIGEGIIGVKTNNLRTGQHASYYANHVILATGGIAGSLKRIRENWPSHFPASAEILAGGSHFAQGLGHDLATQVGAALDNMDKHWFYPIGIPDPINPDSGLGITLTSPRGIWVNSQGERFINPLSSDKIILDAIMQQEPSGFWIIFDDAIRKSQKARTIRYRYDQPRYQREVLFNPAIIRRADDLVTLAARSGLPENSLPATVARYNALVSEGQDTDFGRFPATYSDNITLPAVTPVALKTPPFYAARIYPSNAESMGGVRIDFSGRVLSMQGDIIKGLYAAGEITGSMGMNGSKYRVNGLFLGPSVMTGRIAAASILKALPNIETGILPTLPIKPTTPRPLLVAKQASAENADELRELLGKNRKNRPGYWHFQVSHDVVLSRELPCASCHTASFPPATAISNQQRLAQTNTCVVCH